MPNELVKASPQGLARHASGFILPAVIADAGDQAAKRFVGFFTATIRNPHTRKAYARAAGDFFAWCEQHGLALPAIEPLHVAAYVELITREKSAPTLKQQLAAIRMLFDWLTSGGIIPFNPATSVRGPKFSVKRGKTPVLTADEARQLLDSIDIDTLIGLRDRALLRQRQALVGLSLQKRRQIPRGACPPYSQRVSGRPPPGHRNRRSTQALALPFTQPTERETDRSAPPPQQRPRHGQATGDRRRVPAPDLLPYLPGHRNHGLS